MWTYLEFLLFAHSVLALPVLGAILVFLALGPESVGFADFLDFLVLFVLLADSPLLAVGILLAVEWGMDAHLPLGAGLEGSHTFPPALTIFVGVTLFHPVPSKGSAVRHVREFAPCCIKSNPLDRVQQAKAEREKS